ncbi:NitT/TauT family transport system permease protein [Rhizobium sp. PP-F2F-G48]|uniref:ABC transporter permease n=1 Tax=Rhizobium sp. PP-F2F-G48 TaxID=2135651 RepID=UPI0010D53281|nr:ABC transporter permease [Rhizobium sp. PP-F2F-G48]TCM47191.1 NitT/TauT family transport system permease protein [Rhizobium sp. PP-F2F-G48]
MVITDNNVAKSSTAGSVSQEPGAWTRYVSPDTLIQIGITVFTLTLWEVTARVFKTDFWTSNPSAIALELYRWGASGLLASDLKITLMEAGLGFVIGSGVGGLVGFFLGWVRRMGNLFEPFILSIYTIPKIALAPLFVLWFGIGVFNKVMFAGMLVFFMVFFTTYQGVRQVDRDLVENAQLMGADRWAIWTKIAIPYAAVWVFTGIRIGLPYALIGAIVGEFVAAESGVGYRIKEATSFFNTSAVFAGLLVLMAISFAFLTTLKLIEKYVLRWQNAKGVIQTDGLA